MRNFVMIIVLLVSACATGPKQLPTLDVPTDARWRIGGEGAYGYIDSTGKVVIPRKFQHSETFYEDRAKARHNGLWGFIDPAGEWVIPALYHQATDFKDGYAKVANDASPPEWFVIDKRGEPVTDAPEVNWTVASHRCSEELCARQDEATKKWGFSPEDDPEVWAIPATWAEVEGFSEGMAAVRFEAGGKSGYIDLTGKLVIPLEFVFTNFFRDGLAGVCFAKYDCGYVDREGRTVYQDSAP